MNREQFFRVVSGLDEDRLRKALWNLYWRGTANVRERIEVEFASDGRSRPPRPAKGPVDPETMRYEVDEFVSLARSGAYLGGVPAGVAARAIALAVHLQAACGGSSGRDASRG
jgi:hypothetical protein